MNPFAKKARRSNVQLFALSAPPAECIEVAGLRYRLVRVFKHDFFAATCLYETADSSGKSLRYGQIVVKIYRDQPFLGLPMRWLGRFSRDHEKAIYESLQGIAHLPRFIGCIGQTALAVEYIPSKPLDHFDKPPVGYFDKMREIFRAIHARGVAYVDANKRSNMLVGQDGSPVLVDFQIAVRRRDELPWPIRNMVSSLIRYLQNKDIYHLYKHKRRMLPEELTQHEEAISRYRGPIHRLYRKITKPYRKLRRRFLGKRYREGRLVSPTSHLEDHYQPEKQTWRTP